VLDAAAALAAVTSPEADAGAQTPGSGGVEGEDPFANPIMADIDPFSAVYRVVSGDKPRPPLSQSGLFPFAAAAGSSGSSSAGGGASGGSSGGVGVGGGGHARSLSHGVKNPFEAVVDIVVEGDDTLDGASVKGHRRSGSINNPFDDQSEGSTPEPGKSQLLLLRCARRFSLSTRQCRQTPPRCLAASLDRIRQAPFTLHWAWSRTHCVFFLLFFPWGFRVTAV